MFSETYSIKPKALVFLTRASVLTLTLCSPSPLILILNPWLSPVGKSAFSTLKSTSRLASFTSYCINVGINYAKSFYRKPAHSVSVFLTASSCGSSLAIPRYSIYARYVVISITEFLNGSLLSQSDTAIMIDPIVSIVFARNFLSSIDSEPTFYKISVIRGIKSL